MPGVGGSPRTSSDTVLRPPFQAGVDGPCAATPRAVRPGRNAAGPRGPSRSPLPTRARDSHRTPGRATGVGAGGGRTSPGQAVGSSLTAPRCRVDANRHSEAGHPWRFPGGGGGRTAEDRGDTLVIGSGARLLSRREHLVVDRPPERRKPPQNGGFQSWAWVDSNYRPHAYQACALTT